MFLYFRINRREKDLTLHYHSFTSQVWLIFPSFCNFHINLKPHVEQGLLTYRDTWDQPRFFRCSCCLVLSFPCWLVFIGFGPFGEHTVNASWVAVQELAKKAIPGVIIVIQEIPVEYETVKKQVPQLWEDVNPQVSLVIANTSSCAW